MDSILQGLPNTCAYLDDILVTGKSEAEHLRTLDAALERLENAGIRLKREKCEFMLPKIEYLGHLVTAEGLKPTAEKVRAIQEAPTPRNVQQLRSFLGLINYYRKFLPNQATLLAPLYELLRFQRRWSWGAEQEKAFNEAKSSLLSSRALHHYDPDKELVLSCDASPYGVGAVLSHRTNEKTEQPIVFASRSLSLVERRYSHLDKEALAIIFGVKRFHQYLYGRRFTILSDHCPLKYLLSEVRGIPTMASARVQRWALMLSAYNYVLEYKPGSQHANADALSRLPLPIQPTQVPLPGDTVCLLENLQAVPLTLAEMKKGVYSDRLLSRVLDNVERGWIDTDEPDMRPLQCR